MSELDHVINLTRRNDAIYNDLPGLHAIRLLRIDDFGDPESISCTLTTMEDYREAPSYDALSYCWGTATEVAEITCNGQPFFVTNSLRTTLCRLQRCESSTRLFWIDAMCINQHDDTERGQQVSIMKQIYSCASRVFVWLWPMDEQARKAIRVIRRAADQCCQNYFGPGSDSTRSWRKELKSEHDLVKIANTLSDECSLDDLWSDVTPIFEREWFQRIWVVQEVQSCDETWILCGDECIEWCLVALVAKAIFNRQNSIIGGRATITYARRSTWKKYAIPHARFMAQRVLRTASDVPFLRVLHQTRCFKSTDPRDKIFAMLQHPVQCMLEHITLHGNLEFHARKEKHLTDVALMPSMETKGYSFNKSSSQLGVNDIWA